MNTIPCGGVNGGGIGVNLSACGGLMVHNIGVNP